jgi:hypothetical protein
MQRPPNIISIYAPSPESGKSTVANYLADKFEFQRVPFAGPLKDWLVQFLVRWGYSQQEAWNYSWNDKHLPLELIPGAPTARHLQQTLGTDWGRNLVHQKIWTELWIKAAVPILEAGGRIVVEDMRFPSELFTVQDPRVNTYEGCSAAWRMNRIEANVRAENSGVGKHSSEGGLNTYAPHNFQAWIPNDGTFEELFERVHRALREEAYVPELVAA